MGETTIYYYSGTGNSLHTAKEIGDRIPDSELVPILKLIKNDRIKADAVKVGFVFPIYFTSIPAPMRQFIEKLEMGGVRYTFMIATRIGTFSIAVSLIKKLLKKKGKRLDSHLTVNMAMNSPTGLKPGKGFEKWVEKTSKEEIDRMEKELMPQLDLMAESIKEMRPYPVKGKAQPLNSITCPLMDLMTRRIKSEVGYVVDETCISCGTCERVCLSGKIKLKDGKPHWQKDVPCYYCFACFNFCPQQAILVAKKYDRKDGRYHHPAISLEDIADQKISLP
jgi:ferredoxin